MRPGVRTCSLFRSRRATARAVLPPGANEIARTIVHPPGRRELHALRVPQWSRPPGARELHLQTKERRAEEKDSVCDRRTSVAQRATPSYTFPRAHNSSLVLDEANRAITH